MTRNQDKFADINRREILRLLGAGSAVALLPNLLYAPQVLAQKDNTSSLLVCFLRGGYSGIFSSADTYVGRSFGVTQNNMSDLGQGLFMDQAFIEGLTGGANNQSAEATFIKQHIATVGVRHGITSHDTAQEAIFNVKGQNPVLSIAAALSGTSSIKAANAGRDFINGQRNGNGISLQGINDLRSTEQAIFGTREGPDRSIMAKGMAASLKMSEPAFRTNSISLATLKDGLTTGIATLDKPVEPVNLQQIQQDYNIRSTRIQGFDSKIAAAEFMIRSGTNVVTVVDNGWDNHNDQSHANARRQMQQNIVPSLGKFLLRNINRNVTVVILGDFARTAPGSGHAPALAATVIGKNVKLGTTGRLSERSDLNRNSPGIDGLWAYLAAITGADAVAAAIGGNPHRQITI